MDGGATSMSSRAQQLRERQAANVVANREERRGEPKSRQRLLLKRGDASMPDQASRTLSTNPTLARAKTLQAKQSAGKAKRLEKRSTSGGTRSVAAPEIRAVAGGMRSSSGGSDSSSTDGHRTVSRALRQDDRQERGTDRRTPLAKLLESAGLQDKLVTFEDHRITYDVLAGATDAVLRELLSDEDLGLIKGEQFALRSEVQKVWAAKLPESGEATLAEMAGGGHAHEDTLATSWMVEDFSEIEYDAHGGYLSKGVSGSVYKAQWQGQNCALKIFNYAGGDEEVEAAFSNELDILRKLNHANLVRFLGACVKPPPYGQLGILMELMDGSLASLLYGKASTAPNGKRVEMSDKRLVAIAYGIANGMRFLHHKARGCHRDLKSHNVLYDKQLNIKLCDFAFSKFKAELERKTVKFESRVGTPQWMAPEVLRGEDYTFSADVHSFGVIMWEMIAREQPFADLHAMAVMYKVGTEGLRLEPPDDCPPFWRKLMTACWQAPKLRPTFEQIFKYILDVKRFAAANPQATFADGMGQDLIPDVVDQDGQRGGADSPQVEGDGAGQ